MAHEWRLASRNGDGTDPLAESDPLVAFWRGYKTLLSVRAVSAGSLKDIDKEGRLPHSGNLTFPFIHKS